MRTHGILRTMVAIFLLALSAGAQETGARLENRALHAELNLASGAVTLLDLWRQSDLGPFDDPFPTSAVPHGAELVKIRAARGPLTDTGTRWRGGTP